MDGHKIVQDGFGHWIDIVQQFLDRKLDGRIADRHRTIHSSQYKFDGRLDVDMLVSPFWREPDGLYQFLQSIAPGDRFT